MSDTQMVVKVLWAVRVGNEDWQAELITEREERIAAAIEAVGGEA